MSADTVGIAIEFAVVRAAYRTRQGIVALEVAWDPTRPDVAVAELRERIGDVRAISLSVGLGFLSIAKPELPPVAGNAARRILQRDADRHFPIEGRIAIATGGRGEFAFATPSATLAAWISTFRTWAPITSVHAAPHLIAQVLDSGGANADATSFTIDAGEHERGLLALANGQIREVRRLPESVAAVTLNGARSISDSALKVAEGKYAAAVGALAAAAAPLDLMLLDSSLEHALANQRRMRLWRSIAMFAASLVLLAYAADMQRARMLETVERDVRTLETEAAPAYTAQARLARANAELAMLAESTGSSTDMLATIARLSRALPPGAVVQRTEWDGTEWRVDGSTDNASQVVPALDSVSNFFDVHALGASTRYRDGDRMRESFSVAFKLKGGTNANR